MKRTLFIAGMLFALLNLQAQTDSITYKVSIIMNPAMAGTTTGAGMYLANSIAKVEATPNSGYIFTGWNMNGQLISLQTDFTFLVNGNINLQANFAAAPGNFLVTTLVFPAQAGTTSGQGSYQAGDTAHLRAYANAGYVFNNWTVNGIIVSTDTNYSFAVTANTQVTAAFSAIPDTVEINTVVFPQQGGYTTGQGKYPAGETVTLKAHANAGYRFGAWTVFGIIAGSDTSYTITATANLQITAMFVADTNYYQIAAQTSPEQGGYVTGSGTYAEGDTVTLHAVANPGYIFSHWEEDDNMIHFDSVYSFPATAHRTLRAHFNLWSDIEVTDGASYISVHPNPASGLFFIETNNNYTLIIINTAGQHITSMPIERGKLQITLPKGIYLLYFNDVQNKTIIRKLVVR